ncbi:MAG: RNA polymerase sigma-70 factor [Mangrovibacterium sp.]
MIQTSTQTDLFQLNSLCEGKEKAFDYIFRKYYKALCAQANLYVRDLDLAQSLVQECFLKLWENRANATQINQLNSYLSFVVRNHCIDHLRKSKTKKHTVELTEEAGLGEASDSLLLSHEFEEQLVEALASLPGRCREAFEYSRFEGMTYPEIAKQMNISVKAVEALMSRSLKILRVELKEYMPMLVLFLKICI